MSAGDQTRVGAKPRFFLVAVIAALLTALTLTVPSVGPAAALTDPSPGRYAGKGFDVYTAQPQTLMTAWLASPYRAVGIYIGGVNRFDPVQARLTPQWVSDQRSAGWKLAPIYLGRQPYCTSSTKKFRFTPADAATWGRTEATDGVAKARALGLAVGSTIFNDIEAYSTSDAACRAAVLTYQSAWTARLHDLGFLSGFYSSMDSGVADQVAVYGSAAYVRPDFLWFARPNGIATVTDEDLPDNYWPHRRIKQYQSPAKGLPPLGPETWGGQTLAVDRDQFDVVPPPATPFGDFHGNGWSDVIARRTSTGALYLYPGNGTNLGSASRIGTGWNGMSAITRFGDFNRDGHEDVIARESATGSLWLYPGTGSGLAPRVRIGSSGWNSMREITPVGDLTGDRFGDLLAVQTSTGNLYLYPGRGTSLGARRLIGHGWTGYRELTAVGDFNRDGRVDLVARESATGFLWLYPGKVGGLAARSRIGTGWNGMRDLVGVGDFDRNGYTDLVAVQTATGKLLRYPGQGTSLGAGLVIGTGWSGLQPLL